MLLTPARRLSADCFPFDSVHNATRTAQFQKISKLVCTCEIDRLKLRRVLVGGGSGTGRSKLLIMRQGGINLLARVLRMQERAIARVISVRVSRIVARIAVCMTGTHDVDLLASGRTGLGGENVENCPLTCRMNGRVRGEKRTEEEEGKKEARARACASHHGERRSGVRFVGRIRRRRRGRHGGHVGHVVEQSTGVDTVGEANVAVLSKRPSAKHIAQRERIRSERTGGLNSAAQRARGRHTNPKATRRSESLQRAITPRLNAASRNPDVPPPNSSTTCSSQARTVGPPWLDRSYQFHSPQSAPHGSAHPQSEHTSAYRKSPR